MEHGDFYLGCEFFTASGRNRWRVTDIGARTITAIKVQPLEIRSIANTPGGRERREVYTKRDAEERHWFDGPPYALSETVFDENDQPGCVSASRFILFGED